MSNSSSSRFNENIIKKTIKFFFKIFNYKIVRINNFNDRYNDFIVECKNEDKANIEIFSKISLTTKANMWSIIQSVNYISKNSIQGDIVECGVYMGGTIALIAKYLNKYSFSRKIYAYDTYEIGFSKSVFTEFDKDFKNQKIVNSNNDTTYYPTLDEVKKNIMQSSSANLQNINFIKGDILETLKDAKNLPEKIAFLRMDTDLYATTQLQLEILFPRLSSGGILHIDDYGMCPGVRKAIDDYLNEKYPFVWLHRVDLSCRLFIKP